MSRRDADPRRADEAGAGALFADDLDADRQAAEAVVSAGWLVLQWGASGEAGAAEVDDAPGDAELRIADVAP